MLSFNKHGFSANERVLRYAMRHLQNAVCSPLRGTGDNRRYVSRGIVDSVPVYLCFDIDVALTHALGVDTFKCVRVGIDSEVA